MPIYEYRCRNCGQISELLIGVGQGTEEIKCAHCGSKKLDKIMSQSFIATDGNSRGPRNGKTCCGRDERCSKPPCADGGCKR